METVIIENVRGQWIVDKTTTGAFQEEGCAYADGALIELVVAKHKGLCCHPDNPAVCPHQGGVMVEIKQCPVCWGKKVICVGLKGNLEPILKPCTGCDGTGWIEYKQVQQC